MVLLKSVPFPNITIAYMYLISLKLGKLKLDTKIDFVQFVIQLFFSPKDLLYFKRVSQIDFRGGKEKSKKPAKTFSISKHLYLLCKVQNRNSVHCSQMKRHKCCCFCSDPQLGSDALMSARSNTAASLKKGFANSSSSFL